MPKRKTLKVDLGDLGECAGSRSESGRRSPVVHASGTRLPISDGGLGMSNKSTRSTSGATPNHGNVLALQPRVSIRAFTPAPPLDLAVGLVGWVDLELSELVIVHNVAVRRTRDGEPTLSWPVKDDRKGNRRAVVRPHGDAARVKIEAAVFADLARQGLVSA